ncbi:MAG: SDR family oxidoreductase [Clostridiales bacterium]|jgi:short-subunit dehydrogenase|nr:SDR family oxidoreductase [Clostridiales bacterium]
MKRTAVITGGSRGIGRELVSLFAEKGYTVFNLSRSAGELKSTENIIHVPTDITDDSQVASAFERVKDESGRIDVLINNAGFGISGAVEFTSAKDAIELFDVNFFGVHRCIRLATPLLRGSRGRVINVSSAAAIFPIPFQSFYSASKAAINSFSLALANELKDFGISVCAVMPGDVKTDFTAARQKNAAGDDLYGGQIEKAVSIMEKDEQGGLSPSDIAKEILSIAEKRRIKPLYTLGGKYKLFAVLQKLLPAGIVNRAIRMLYIK